MRHGETTWNVERRFQGQLDVQLSKTGLRQAEAVARWLTPQPADFTAVYSSDLQRAYRTAPIIGTKLGPVPELDPALREINVGEWQGLIASEIEAPSPASWKSGTRKSTASPCPAARAFRRARAHIRSIPGDGRATSRRGHHRRVDGAALAALIAALHDWDLVDTWHTERARIGKPTWVAVFDHERSEHEVMVMNSGNTLNRPATWAARLTGAQGERKPKSRSNLALSRGRLYRMDKAL